MLRPTSEAVGLMVGDGVRVGESVLFGAHVVVYDGTQIGDGSVIEHGAALGMSPRVARTSSASRAELFPLRIGASVTVCAGAVVFAASEIGDEAIIGDQRQVRERTTIGKPTVVGRAAGVDHDVRIDDRVKIQSQVYVTAYSVVEDDVFLGPSASMTNDDTMRQHGPEYALRPPTVRRAARIGDAAVLVPGVEVGEEAFLAASPVVTKDVPARAIAVGVPARQVREVADGEVLERWR